MFFHLYLALLVSYLSFVSGDITEEDCLDPINKIIEENCKLGNDSQDWDVNADGDPSIQGFSDPFSVNIGQEIRFKIKTDSKVGDDLGRFKVHVDLVLGLPC